MVGAEAVERWRWSSVVEGSGLCDGDTETMKMLERDQLIGWRFRKG